MAELPIAFALRSFREGGLLLPPLSDAKPLVKPDHLHAKPWGILAKESNETVG
jgi:hypothetical protein